MDETEIKKMAQAVVEGNDVDFSKLFSADDEDEGQVNFWIPTEYKQKYAQLQRASGKNFGKLVKEVIMTCIDRAGTKAS